ncbi:CDP-alcohol phosphatidyltransferase family protein [Desulfobacterium sp. N47]|uniref:CDP-diacylglycerol--glycerol-3-phosphate 3-phosphatidyltransferase n=1 Tax=uncultured Desulfobacterium sp. TaxID=201089 RepID=E1YBK2_9BACT|nr:CDP-diacylglycerol--glycerol-3-phosphate3-phosphatidyltransferase [uncultured Desulfobacterium sp.]
MNNSRILYILKHPNSLTIYRMAAIPAIVVFLLFQNKYFTLIAALLFSAAAITDYLDGYLARRWGLVSNIGKFMDPLADKLLISCSCIMMASFGWIPAWVVCIIIGRELAVTGLRSIIAEHGQDVAASKLGKYKTGFQVAAIIPLLTHYPYMGINFHAIGMVFLWAALILTVWSGMDYFVHFWKLFKE